MRKRLTQLLRPQVLVAGISIVVGLGAVIGVTGAGSSPDASYGGLRTRGCQDFSEADYAAESQEMFDPATGTLRITTEGAVFELSEGDRYCQANPRTRRKLTLAREMENSNHAAMCASFRAAIAEGRTHEKGQPLNLGVAAEFVNKECG